MGKIGKKDLAILCAVWIQTLILFVGCSPEGKLSKVKIKLPSASLSQSKLSSLSTDPRWGLSDPINSNSVDLSGVGCYAILIKDKKSESSAAQCVQDNGDVVLKAHQFLGLYEADSTVEINDFEPNSEKTLYLIGFGANSLSACQGQSFPLADGLSLSAPQLLAEETVKVPGGEDIVVNMQVDLSQVKKIESCDGNILQGKDNQRYFSIRIADTTVTEGDNAAVMLTLSHPAPEDLIVDYMVVAGDGEAADLVGITLGTVQSVVVPRGQLSAAITISTHDDNIYEPSVDDFRVSIMDVKLASDSATSIGYIADSDGVLTIADNESMPEVSFQLASSSAALTSNNNTLNMGEVDIFMVVSHHSETTISYDFSFSGSGGAVYGNSGGQDFTMISGNVTYSKTYSPGGSLTSSVRVYVSSAVTSGRVANFALSNVTGATLGANSSHALTLQF